MLQYGSVTVTDTIHKVAVQDQVHALEVRLRVKKHDMRKFCAHGFGVVKVIPAPG